MDDKNFWRTEVRLVTGEPSAIKDYVAKSFKEIESKESICVFRVSAIFGLAFEDSFYKNLDEMMWIEFWAARSALSMLSQKPELMKKIRKKYLQEVKKKIRASLTPRCDQVGRFNFQESPAYHDLLVEIMEDGWLAIYLLREIQDIYKKAGQVPVLFIEGLESVLDRVNGREGSISLSSPLLDRSPVIGVFKFFQECERDLNGLNPRTALDCEIWDRTIFCNRSHLRGRTIDLRQ